MKQFKKNYIIVFLQCTLYIHVHQRKSSLVCSRRERPGHGLRYLSFEQLHPNYVEKLTQYNITTLDKSA